MSTRYWSIMKLRHGKIELRIKETEATSLHLPKDIKFGYGQNSNSRLQNSTNTPVLDSDATPSTPFCITACYFGGM